MNLSRLLTEDEEPKEEQKQQAILEPSPNARGDGVLDQGSRGSVNPELNGRGPIQRKNSANSTGDRRGNEFACEICSRVFSARRDLETHTRTVHEKMRPFKCEECGRTFGTKSNLKTHTRSVHEGQRPFVCLLCNFRFKTRGNLSTHIETVHEQRRPYVCKICTQTFGTRSVMNRHVKKVHGQKIPNTRTTS
ncbi:hypothetical protein NDN08_008105 [Rhodosorus marinus]|uniref:C2H2-type domain-containing protein n=1 Tax=Rhodosorus marinus TaxID=101924 RepID=A0AAV8V129_9RHOD|nr:hypothetical protein NDN08_008105 [Rhodosorus marinus]